MSDRPLPADLDATDRRADRAPDRPISAAPSPEGNNRPEGPRPDLSARDLQEDVQASPGSDADQAAEAPKVG